jgi:hypothetical protein
MERLFDIKCERLSNKPTIEEIRFITTYLEKQFAEIENIDLPNTEKKDKDKDKNKDIENPSPNREGIPVED